MLAFVYAHILPPKRMSKIKRKSKVAMENPYENPVFHGIYR
jgi:hypothetical protein